MKNFSLFLFWILLFSSCNTRSVSKTKEVPSTNIFDENHIIENTVIKQIFTIKTDEEQVIIGKQGTVVIFPLNCFGDIQNGVKIELIECYSIQDMIFNNLSTQTKDGKILESEGMIYINAFSTNGDTLKIKKGKVKVKMPTKQIKKDIQIFEGFETNNSTTWRLITNKIEKNTAFQTNNTEDEFVDVPCCEDSILQPKISKSQMIIDKQIKNENLVNYVFNITKLGWINCDRFINGETQDLFVNVKEDYKNIKLYLVFNELNSNVLPLWPEPVKGQIKFTNISLNSSFTLIGIATKGDKIYFGMDNYLTHKGTVDCPELKAITRQDLTDLLMKKFGKDIWHRPNA